GDTRIFSPLLYQLSYGTMHLTRCKDKDKIPSPQAESKKLQKRGAVSIFLCNFAAVSSKGEAIG
ncbi:MAG: hypothetical protein ACI3X4_09625, partial [Bacteroidaceae bacterium]